MTIDETILNKINFDFVSAIAVAQNSTSQMFCFIAPITLAISNFVFDRKFNGEPNALLDFDFKPYDLISVIFSVIICSYYVSLSVFCRS